LLAAFGVFLTLPRFPDVRRGFDMIGFLIIAVALCGLQLALDRGTQEDWFSSTEIIVELGLSAAAFWMLAFYLPMARHPILAISLFRNVTFLTACMMVFFILAISTASSALVPSLLQNLMGYPISTAGIVLIPRGVALALAMLAGARLMKMVDNRILIFVGLGILAWSLELHSRFTLDMDADLVIWSGVVMGIGSGLAMGSVNFMAISSTTVELRTDAAALYGLFRSIGQALIIAIATALLAHDLQVGHAELGSAIQIGNLPFNLARMLGGAHSSEMVAGITDIEINRQAMMIAYINDFWLMMWALIVLMPFVLLMRPARAPRAEPMMVVE
jgi:MFS transporter, DHA2 family, multidrug resistance protein